MIPFGQIGLLARVAWRNLGRNRRRTFITGTGIALAVGMCIATYGFVDGMDGDLEASVTRVALGDVQIHAARYLALHRVDLTIHDPEVLAAVDRTAGVVAAAPRVRAWGLGSAGTLSAGLQLVGVDPIREGKVGVLPERVVAGAFLPVTATAWRDATPLTEPERRQDDELTAAARRAAMSEIAELGEAPEPRTGPAGPSTSAKGDIRGETRKLVAQIAPQPASPPPVVLGAKLASKLHVVPGSSLTLSAADADGAPAEATFRVVGVIQTNAEEVDRSYAMLHLIDLQRFLRLDRRIHEVAVRTLSSTDADGVAMRLRAAPALRDLDVQTWTQLRPDVLAMINLNDSLMGTLIVVAFAVAAVGVVNTMLISVFERKRELGLLKALGMRPGTVVAMVLLETTILAAAASAAGSVLGVGLDEYLLHVGVDLRRFLGTFSLAGVTFPPVLHAGITAHGVGVPVVVMFLLAELAAVFPSITAARTPPAVGMRDR